MGRSVETIGDNIVYFDTSEFCEDNIDWEDLCDNIICALTSQYKSFISTPNQWAKCPYRENKILLENDHVQISIAEYCGCGAVSVFVRDNTEYPELAEHWLLQIWDTISEIIGQFVLRLNRLGTFSNGCGVFEQYNKTN
ncbi:hypothetical protein LCGC14_0437510 [marine sediment metagenome]|uniref:Uncharacterized protein n=1 Tax=marine sediment metagenome TaxID=412755 RepID=A0A0F9SLF2_9ZZZZ